MMKGIKLDKANLPAPETELEKPCLGICGGEVVVWLVLGPGGVTDYVMYGAWPRRRQM
jgi:hypothetical protein